LGNAWPVTLQAAARCQLHALVRRHGHARARLAPIGEGQYDDGDIHDKAKREPDMSEQEDQYRLQSRRSDGEPGKLTATPNADGTDTEEQGEQDEDGHPEERRPGNDSSPGEENTIDDLDQAPREREHRRQLQLKGDQQWAAERLTCHVAPSLWRLYTGRDRVRLTDLRINCRARQPDPAKRTPEPRCRR